MFISVFVIIIIVIIGSVGLEEACDRVPYSIALGELEHTLQPRLTSNSQRSACLSLLSAEIIGISHHGQLLSFFLGRNILFIKS